MLVLYKSKLTDIEMRIRRSSDNNEVHDLVIKHVFGAPVDLDIWMVSSCVILFGWVSLYN